MLSLYLYYSIVFNCQYYHINRGRAMTLCLRLVPYYNLNTYKGISKLSSNMLFTIGPFSEEHFEVGLSEFIRNKTSFHLRELKSALPKTPELYMCKTIQLIDQLIYWCTLPRASHSPTRNLPMQSLHERLLLCCERAQAPSDGRRAVRRHVP